MEEAPARDIQGVFGALVLSFALVPFQGWAAFKGLVSKDEGPWFRTPKTGHVTDQVHHLRRLQMLRTWMFRRGRAGRKVAPPPRPAKQPVASTGVSMPARWLGWLLAGGLVLAFGALAWMGSRAPVVDAAGNPLYLHGTGTAPGCVASTFDQAIGTRTTACQIQSSSGGVTNVWAFSSLPAQTVAAGVWTFTMNWTGGSGSTNDTVTVAAGVSPTASCAGFTALVPNAGSTWTATYGSGSVNPSSSPLTVTTSASQSSVVIPAGGSLCISVTLTHGTGGKPSLVYDGTAATGNTNVVPPSIVVPESLVGFAGLAVLIPLITSRRSILAFVRRRS